MLEIRRFAEQDAGELSAMIEETLRISNSRDYPPEEIQRYIRELCPQELIARSRWMHFYVCRDGQRLVGCGGIGPYWGSKEESSLFTIFVLPSYQGQGLGRKIMETLEQDEFFLRARRVEIPASITACSFYRKMGYDYKNGIAQPDETGKYRLEKYREPSQE